MSDDDIVVTLRRRLYAEADRAHGKFPEEMLVSEDELRAVSRWMAGFQFAHGLAVITDMGDGRLGLWDTEQEIYHNLKFMNVTLRLAPALT